jgi:hypothetical protein
VLREPKDVQQQRRAEEAAANAARVAAQRAEAEGKTKMKGRNKPTRRQKRRQMNVIEDRKPALRLKVAEEVGVCVVGWVGEWWWLGGSSGWGAPLTALCA